MTDIGSIVWYSNSEYWKIDISDAFENEGCVTLCKNSYVGEKWNTTTTISGYYYSATITNSSRVISISETEIITFLPHCHFDCVSEFYSSIGEKLKLTYPIKTT